MVEFAIVAPLTLLFIFAIVVGGFGVFRKHQVAHLAREASRWASTHGTCYAQETGNPAATADDVANQVFSNTIGLDPTCLTCTVTWNTDNRPSQVLIVNGQVVPRTNTVTVTVTYQWLPEAVFSGTTLQSTSILPMSF